MNVISVISVTVNSLCCGVVGLVVWYWYDSRNHETLLSTRDSSKYVIIGALQLWMLLFADVAVLITEVCTRGTL